jgi:hypothetical protein
LSAPEVARRDRKLQREQEMTVSSIIIDEEKAEVQSILTSEQQDDDQTVMFMQQLQEDSLYAGPLLSSVQTVLNDNEDGIPSHIKNRVQSIKTDEEHRSDIIQIISEHLPVDIIAEGIQTIEIARKPKEVIYVGNNDDEASSTRDALETNNSSSSSNKETVTVTDEDDMDIEEIPDKPASETKASTKQRTILTEEEKLLIAMEKKGLKLPPANKRQRMIARKHAEAHFGRDNIYEAIMRNGYW